MDRADTVVKWPKWALAVLFLVDGAGFGTWAAHVPVFKQFLHFENGSLTFVLISVISATATIGYCGFLTGPPIIGSLAVMIGLRQAMGVIVLCGIMVAVGPIFLPLQSTSRSSNEEAVTTGASVFD
jgi:MFS family permease